MDHRSVEDPSESGISRIRPVHRSNRRIGRERDAPNGSRIDDRIVRRKAPWAASVVAKNRGHRQIRLRGGRQVFALSSNKVN
jgi:hypothetical protein